VPELDGELPDGSGRPAHRAASGARGVDPRRLTRWILWSLLAVWTVALVAAAWDGRAYSPDSWAYWDMAQRVQEGQPYTMHGVRQFQTEPGIAISFPLLYPALLALVDAVTGLGFRTGLVVNAAAVLGAAAVIESRWGRGHLAGLGPLSLLASATWYPFANEVAAARTMPVAVLLLCSLAVLATRTSTLRGWAMCGIVGGALYLTRFDALLAVVAFPVVLVAVRVVARRSPPRGAEVASIAAYAAGFVLAVGPTLAIGLVTVGQLPTSDNARTAASATTVYVTHYHPDGVPTLVDAPRQWASKVLDNVSPLLSTTGDAALAVLVFVAVALVLAATVWQRSSAAPEEPGPRDRLVLVALLLSFAVSLSFGVLTTGFVNLRYWSPLVLLSMLIVVHTTVLHAPADALRRAGPVVTSAAMLALVVLLAALQLPLDRGALSGRLQERASFSTTAVPRTLNETQPPMPDLSCADDEATVLSLVHDRAASREAALGSRMIMSRPGNLRRLDGAQLERFLDDYQPDHVVALDEDDLGALQDAVQLEVTACAGLYRIRPE
jgi:hypothetical protein